MSTTSDPNVLHPADEHNLKLRDNVHPADWPTKPSTQVYDMVVTVWSPAVFLPRR